MMTCANCNKPIADAYCNKCHDDIDGLNDQIAALTAEQDALRTENVRLSEEHKLVHAWNNQLVSEHYALRSRIDELEAELSAAQKALGMAH